MFISMLFDLDTIPDKKETCKDCKNKIRLQFNNTGIYYCKVKKSGRTHNGLLKIKLKNKACNLIICE